MPRYFSFAGRCLLLVLLGLAGGASAASAVAARSQECAITGATPAEDDVRDARQLQRSIETHPLFLKAAAASVVRGCTANFESAGRFVLDYRFRGKQSLRVERDTTIEYTAIKSSFQLAPGEQAETILRQAERASFGASGCGLDLQHADSHPVQYEPQVNETVYEGTVCNCHGTIRRDAKRQVIGFILTSAC